MPTGKKEKKNWNPQALKPRQSNPKTSSARRERILEIERWRLMDEAKKIENRWAQIKEAEKKRMGEEQEPVDEVQNSTDKKQDAFKKTASPVDDLKILEEEHSKKKT